MNDAEIGSWKSSFCGCRKDGLALRRCGGRLLMSLGGHWVQAHGESVILLVANKIDFGAKELSNQ